MGVQHYERYRNIDIVTLRYKCGCELGKSCYRGICTAKILIAGLNYVQINYHTHYP